MADSNEEAGADAEEKREAEAQGNEDQRDEGSGDQTEQTTGVGNKDQSEMESGTADDERDEGEGGGREKDTQQQNGGSPQRRQADGRPSGSESDELDLSDTSQIDAVEKFDQLGQQQSPDAENIGQTPGEVGKGGSTYMILVEQQLDGIEGDPAELLHNRFKLEERRRLQPRNLGGMIYEPRPW